MMVPVKTYRAIESAIQRMRPADATILAMRLGIDGEVHTMAQIAEHYGLTTQAVPPRLVKAARRARSLVHETKCGRDSFCSVLRTEVRPRPRSCRIDWSLTEDLHRWISAIDFRRRRRSREYDECGDALPIDFEQDYRFLDCGKCRVGAEGRIMQFANGSLVRAVSGFGQSAKHALDRFYGPGKLSDRLRFALGSLRTIVDAAAKISGEDLGQMTDSPKLIKPEVVASILGVSVQSVRLWARNGRLPALKVGKFLRFREADIREYAVDHERPAYKTRVGRENALLRLKLSQALEYIDELRCKVCGDICSEERCPFDQIADEDLDTECPTLREWTIEAILKRRKERGHE